MLASVTVLFINILWSVSNCWRDAARMHVCAFGRPREAAVNMRSRSLSLRISCNPHDAGIFGAGSGLALNDAASATKLSKRFSGGTEAALGNCA